MPTLDLTEDNFHADFLPFTGLYVLSLMLFPRDEAEQTIFVDGFIGEGLSRAIRNSDEPITANGKIADWLARASHDSSRREQILAASLKSFKGKGQAHIHRGVLAGEIVLTALLVHFQTGQTIGPGAAQTALMKSYAPAKLRGASAETTRKAWQRYLPVAHLWAADAVCRANAREGRLSLRPTLTLAF